MADPNPLDGFHFRSTKRYGPISTGHRQWRDDSHCAFIHGYGRYIEFVFAGQSLDDRTWLVDFGGLRHVKAWIESQWDHRLLLSSDDPYLAQIKSLEKNGIVSINVMDITKGWSPGIEGSCKFLFDNINPMIIEMTEGRCWIESVCVWEHENNSAIYYNPTCGGPR